MQQQQHQQPPQSQLQPPTLNSGAPFSSNAITSDQIQKCLDDNKNLIMAILENQNLGKFQECAQYQAILQKNLMYLAAIADAQPPTQQPSTPQMPPNSIPQQPNNYMQQQHQITATQQGGIGGGGGGVPKLPFQLNALRTQDQQQQLLQFQQQQQQQQLQAQMGMRPSAQNGMLGMHQAMQSALAGNPGSLMDGRGNKQDGSETAASGGGGGNRES